MTSNISTFIIKHTAKFNNYINSIRGVRVGIYKENNQIIHKISFSMALQPFGPCPLFQFLNPLHSRYGSLDGEAVRRKAAT
jgi:hypothetical protein